MRALLRYAWASPATLVGLGVAGFALLAGARAAMREGVLEVAGGGFGRAVSRLPPLLRFSAITLGHVVLAIDAAALEECRCHERVHVRQYERWGVLFFPLYVGSSLLALARGRDPYWENHFEREAYRAERSARRRSVSRAVRD
ncbi:MAG TPA: signal peptide prediction [Burkholderiales bacterium]